jgi:hypothetical protein
MPWGDKNRTSRNVYEHLVGRHRFDYSMQKSIFLSFYDELFLGTYVNYEQDEDAMIAEAVERSMLYH